MEVKNFIGMSVILSMFLGSCVYAEGMLPAMQVNSAVMELNPMLHNTVPRVISQNAVKTQTYVNSNKQLAPNKDLQIEGHVEKTQKDPLYTNQNPMEMQDLVSTIGNSIIIRNGLPNNIKFKYVDQETVNANTNINNTVTVYKGLLKYCEDKDELAYVIGHEIGHAVSYHVIKGTAANAASNIATKAAIFGISQVTGNQWATMGIETAAKLGTGAAEKKYSRVQETDADLLSIDYIVKAGYNPLAAISIMNKIGENYADFWKDHPSTDKRIVEMYNYIKLKYPQYIEKGYDSTAYNQAIQMYINYSRVSNHRQY